MLGRWFSADRRSAAAEGSPSATAPTTGVCGGLPLAGRGARCRAGGFRPIGDRPLRKVRRRRRLPQRGCVAACLWQAGGRGAGPVVFGRSAIGRYGRGTPLVLGATAGGDGAPPLQCGATKQSRREQRHCGVAWWLPAMGKRRENQRRQRRAKGAWRARRFGARWKGATRAGLENQEVGGALAWHRYCLYFLGG